MFLLRTSHLTSTPFLPLPTCTAETIHMFTRSPISVILHQCLADALTEPQVRAALEESISNSLFGTGSRAFRPVKGAIRFAGSGISKAGRSTGNGLKGLHGKMRTIIRNASGEKESEVEVNPLTESELLAEEEGSDRTSIKKRSVEDGLASLRGKVKNLLRKTSDKSRDTKREEATNDSEAEPSPERED